jgi:hypothetical protein
MPSCLTSSRWRRGGLHCDSPKPHSLVLLAKTAAVQIARYQTLICPCPLGQELWCKKGPPTAELISHYPPQPPLPLVAAALPPDPVDMERLSALTASADALGVLLQNRHQVCVLS